jgi:PAS domain S-box-containing protein
MSATLDFPDNVGKRAEPGPPADTVNILLVDDESRNLDVLESILAAPDLRFVRATSPNDALLALIHDEFACIVLDIQMPNMSGIELARLIKTRKRTQCIPIIFLTAYFSDEKDVLQGYDAGAVDYLTKPINSHIFKSKVGVFVDLFRTTRALSVANAALEKEVSQRKKAEEALRTVNSDLEMRVQDRTAELSLSEKRYREVVRSLPVAIYTTDAEGYVNLFNEAAVDLWGCRPQPGKSLWCGSYKIKNPDGTPLPAEACPMAITLKSGQAVRGQEIIIERPDGSERNVLPYPEPIRNPEGKLIGAVNMLVDVTDQKRSQGAARRLAAIVESSDAAIISKNLDGIITSWNKSARRLFGYAAAEVIGKHITILFPPDRLDEELKILGRVRQGESINHYETVRRRKNGTLIDISLTVSPIKDDDGRIVGASKIVRDITEQKRNEKQRHALYDLISAINRSSSLPEVCEAALVALLRCQDTERASILLADADGVMRFKNWHGLSEEYCRAVEGHSPWQQNEPDAKPVFVDDIGRVEMAETLRSALQKERIGSLAFIPIVYEKRLLGKFMIYFEEAHHFTLDEVRPAQTIASQIALAIERQRVLAELKHAHDELVAALCAKDDFLAALSHELRTPLNPILLIASDAVNNHDLPPRARTDFDTIRKNVELEARLIDDLLDLTRVARGKILLDKSHVKLHGVLEDVVAQVAEEINQKRIELTLALSPAGPAVHADAVRLHQIFWNLIKNAVKFTPEGGKIRIESQVTDGHVVVAIADTGIGLTADEMTNIFDAFSQGDHAKVGGNHQFGGLGLGLTISQKLAELHAGKIYAKSEGRNQGATFTVKLPLLGGTYAETASAAPPTKNSTAPSRKGEIRILLVEDHEATRISLARLLIRRNYDVVTAASLTEARNVLNGRDFHLLISDIGLPDGNGCDLMAELKKTRALKGIALTGFGMEQDLARSREAGFVTHLIKPVRIQSLETALNMVLQSRDE